MPSAYCIIIVRNEIRVSEKIQVFCEFPELRNESSLPIVRIRIKSEPFINHVPGNEIRVRMTPYAVTDERRD